MIYPLQNDDLEDAERTALCFILLADTTELVKLDSYGLFQ